MSLVKHWALGVMLVLKDLIQIGGRTSAARDPKDFHAFLVFVGDIQPKRFYGDPQIEIIEEVIVIS